MRMRTSGFSLVELSIVLVILGLLTGGILTGQSLIRAAELRAVTTEIQEYSTALYTFKNKYFALPGDMPNATQFWGKDATFCNAHSGTASPTGTCNGNGDGSIDRGISGGNAFAENYTLWKHLALSGLINGQYTGVTGSGGIYHSIIGENSPALKLSGSTFYMITEVITGNHIWLDGTYTNSLIIAKPNSFWTDAAVLAPEEAWNIDKKIDDGHPGMGKVNIGRWGDCTTPTSGAAVSSNRNISYNLQNNSTLCNLIFINMF